MKKLANDNEEHSWPPNAGRRGKTFFAGSVKIIFCHLFYTQLFAVPRLPIQIPDKARGQQRCLLRAEPDGIGVS